METRPIRTALPLLDRINGLKIWELRSAFCIGA
jgi:hypothetical protein